MHLIYGFEGTYSSILNTKDFTGTTSILPTFELADDIEALKIYTLVQTIIIYVSIEIALSSQ